MWMNQARVTGCQITIALGSPALRLSRVGAVCQDGGLSQDWLQWLQKACHLWVSRIRKGATASRVDQSQG